jgi:glycosyltransferase involved in cell wall biosynthesis
MKLAIIGTVGVPSCYGGFETMAENLVVHAQSSRPDVRLTVWCSAVGMQVRPPRFKHADLRYIPLKANGVQSILYDVVSLLDAIRTGHDRILLLGVSGALVLPLIRLISRARVATNIDGIEWRRSKWSGPARVFLRASEWAAVRFSHTVIADNKAIADYVRNRYGRECLVIAYGGDHAVAPGADGAVPTCLPARYALALCRIEPENNVHLILEAWSKLDTPLVFVGNWSGSAYGRDLKSRFKDKPNLHLLDPIYEPGALKTVRSRAALYVHGHSAGGTNPSLVEMMHFGVPVLAYDCAFNRETTENKALYFETSNELVELVRNLTPAEAARIGADMLEIARRRYTWDRIGEAYFALLDAL